jgi:hypothetical protein
MEVPVHKPPVVVEKVIHVQAPPLAVAQRNAVTIEPLSRGLSASRTGGAAGGSPSGHKNPSVEANSLEASPGFNHKEPVTPGRRKSKFLKAQTIEHAKADVGDFNRGEDASPVLLEPPSDPRRKRVRI